MSWLRRLFDLGEVAGWPEDRRRQEARTRLVEARRHLENALGSFEEASSPISYAAEDGGTSAQDRACFEGSMHAQQALARLREALVLDSELELGGVRLVALRAADLRPYGSSTGSVRRGQAVTGSKCGQFLVLL